LTPVTQADVGGGAWRVKWHPSPSRKHDLLVACMHDGFKLVKFRDVWDANQSLTAYQENWKIAQTFDEHNSLAYGVDWSFADDTNEAGKTIVASVSFYDHSLFLWRA